jgi:CRP-like cAMP-binding protein
MRKVLYIFGLLNDADIEWMARTGIRRLLSDGEIIIREGKRSDFVVFLLQGELLVTTRSLGEIASMGAGEVVGEMSMVDSAPPSATISARGTGFALFLDKVKLEQKLDSDEGFSSRFYRALAVFLADRLRDARRSTSTSSALADDDVIDPDELDMGILDRVSDAGERFNRMLRTLGDGSLSG